MQWNAPRGAQGTEHRIWMFPDVSQQTISTHDSLCWMVRTFGHVVDRYLIATLYIPTRSLFLLSLVVISVPDTELRSAF